uniref:Secreted protein n=1 Tax=Picea glauca TaxID=3330 RepID=A0A101LYG6_PICGL|nr:hypothetical protein ABT39_MTgene5838 [Picea glauca]QHR92321.1 hypothetical protein Q903MT_gene6363 [Picea sitchensis]
MLVMGVLSCPLMLPLLRVMPLPMPLPSMPMPMLGVIRAKRSNTTAWTSVSYAFALAAGRTSFG